MIHFGDVPVISFWAGLKEDSCNSSHTHIHTSLLNWLNSIEINSLKSV